MSAEQDAGGRKVHPPMSERLQAELDLLTAMYPDSITFNPTSLEIHFKPDSASTGAKLVLRLPDTYPDHGGAPEVVLATGSQKQDLRQQLSKACKTIHDDLGGGGEVLDAIFLHFTDIIAQSHTNTHNGADQHSSPSTSYPASKTVIIWLHHLLATSKRKLALHPSNFPHPSHHPNIPANTISGITKPGYPGILLFTGPQDAVDEHVSELKRLNWQAFSVRLEEDERWVIGGDGGEDNGQVNERGGIKEVETMAEVVQMIEEGKREVFLKAVGVK